MGDEMTPATHPVPEQQDVKDQTAAQITAAMATMQTVKPETHRGRGA